ncbi:hypothetical protein [Neobacillus niacini]|uniref:hypothetical protein n=1 Tax=Neobacillus niacini TaxID=86668 RepID=UPI003983AE65
MVQKVIDQKDEVQKKERKKVGVSKVEKPKVEETKVEVEEVELGKETSYVSDPIINTVWDQFENAVSRTRELREQRQELYLKAIKETTKFNGVYRKTVKGLFEQSTKLSGGLRKGLFQSNIIKTNESAKEVAESYKSHVSEAASKVEELYLTPMYSIFDLMERTENVIDQNSQSFFENINEVRHAWDEVTDNYLKQVRKTHQKIAHQLEDSVRVLVVPGK